MNASNLPTIFDSWTLGLQGLSIQISFAIGLLFLRKVSRNLALVVGGALFVINLGFLPLSLTEYLGSGVQGLSNVRSFLESTRGSEAASAFRAHLFNVFCMTFSPSLVFGVTSFLIWRSKPVTV